MPDTFSTSTNASSSLQTVFEAYGDWTTIPFIALPLGLCVWSFKVSQTYYKDNEQFYTTIEDNLNNQTFKKTLLPLFSYIDNDLSTKVINAGNLGDIGDVNAFIDDFNTSKKQLLSEYDFSYLSEAIEFQDSIEKIIKSKKDISSFKNLLKRSRAALISLTIFSGLTLLCGFLFVGLSALNGFTSNLTIGLAIAWIIFFSLSLVAAGLYYFFKVNLEGLRYE